MGNIHHVCYPIQWMNQSHYPNRNRGCDSSYGAMNQSHYLNRNGGCDSFYDAQWHLVSCIEDNVLQFQLAENVLQFQYVIALVEDIRSRIQDGIILNAHHFVQEAALSPVPYHKCCSSFDKLHNHVLPPALQTVKK